jgi:DNA modification methylase
MKLRTLNKRGKNVYVTAAETVCRSEVNLSTCSKCKKFRKCSLVKEQLYLYGITETTDVEETLIRLEKAKISKHQSIVETIKQIPIEVAVNDQDKITEFTHPFFSYPARFSPKIPRAFISKYTDENDWIIDPFCGCGTSLLEGLLQNRRVIGIDLNSFATFLSDVITYPISHLELEHSLEKIKEKYKILKKQYNLKNLVERCSLFEKKDIEFLPEEIRKQIFLLWSSILSLSDKHYQNFFLCGLSYVCKSLLGTRRKLKIEEDLWYYLFLKRAVYMINKMNELENYILTQNWDTNGVNKLEYFRSEQRRKIYNCSAKEVDLSNIFPSSKERCRLIITSPPYPDVHIEYNNLMLEGRRGSKLLYRLCQLPEEIRRPIEYRLGNKNEYFKLLQDILITLNPLLHDKGKAVFVIGFKEPETQIAEFTHICETAGFQIEKQFQRNIPNRAWYTQLDEKKRKCIPTDFVFLLEKRTRSLLINVGWEDIELKRPYEREEYKFTHDIHQYTASFTPAIPRKALDQAILECKSEKGYINPDFTVLDNFCGSGTTILEARLLGLKSIGIDINEVAIEIAKVKTTPLNPYILLQHGLDLLTNICSEISKFPNIKDNVLYIPKKYEIELKKWFVEEDLIKLAIIMHFIKKISEESDKYKYEKHEHFNIIAYQSFMKICFSSILKKVCGVNRKFITDNYVRNRQRKYEVFDIFKKTFYEMYKAMQIYYEYMKTNGYLSQNHEDFCKIIKADARHLREEIQIENNSVDIAITSPPYLNQVDYIKEDRLTRYWFELPMDNSLEIGARSKRGSISCVKEYIEAMKLSINEVYEVLKPGAKYYFVINETELKKKTIPIVDIIIDIAKDLGFILDKNGLIELKLPGHFNPNRQSRTKEYLLILKKKK